MQLWEHSEELLQCPNALPKHFAAKRKSMSGSSFKQCKSRSSDDLISSFMKSSNTSVLGWIKSYISNNSGGKVWSLQFRNDAVVLQCLKARCLLWTWNSQS